MGSERTTREKIIDAANRLFYREGIRAVSVDAVAEAAGLTKRSLYYHFTSKDELVADYLRLRDHPNLQRYQAWYAAAEGGVEERIGAIFDHLEAEAGKPGWKGCGFLRTAAELVNQPGHPALKIGVEHKKRVEAWFAEILTENGVSEPGRVARQVCLLIDGAFSQAMLYRDPDYFNEAGLAAQALVRSAVSGAST
ncbi:TetR family transcriptional regulator [Rhizobium sp. Root274]|uniref:TetR/AcrR family transcriptional regulator n=1 Tax=unclassified Rhizobium TaxID=2613769 RepID=UPI00071439F5|nr:MULTISPECIES: TetR/AcrR family transcriptional regulator [unclassified Rhizobium]KQW32098.1 TetR family transcriptional regulator [Rhizobium sp. Root1240]KRD33636.1 TetR family transcriptional regulator [Rhizobium sp. Root274]